MYEKLLQQHSDCSQYLWQVLIWWTCKKSHLFIDSIHLVLAILDGVRNSFVIFYPQWLLIVFPYLHYPLYRWVCSLLFAVFFQRIREGLIQNFRKTVNLFFWRNLCKTDHQNLETFWNMFMIFYLEFHCAVLYIWWSVWLLKGILLFATLLPTGVLHQKRFLKVWQKLFNKKCS